MATNIATRSQRKIDQSILGKCLEAVVPDGHSLPTVIEDILRRIEAAPYTRNIALYDSENYRSSAKDYFQNRGQWSYKTIATCARQELECIIKLYFEKISGKLISTEIFGRIPAMFNTNRVDSQLIKSLIQSLPKHNWMALNAVLKHLAKVIHSSKSSLSDISWTFSFILVDTTGRHQKDNAHYYLLSELIEMEMSGKLQQNVERSYSIQCLDGIIGRPLEQVIGYEEMIPGTINKLMSIIEEHHSDKERLYYKKDPTPKTLREAFELTGTDIDIHDFSSITLYVKLFIELIPGKLISLEVFNSFLNRVRHANGQYTFDDIFFAIDQLPHNKRKVIAVLIRHLARILQHSSTTSGIFGVCFGQLCFEKDNSSSKKIGRDLQNKVIEEMINYQVLHIDDKEKFFWMQNNKKNNEAIGVPVLRQYNADNYAVKGPSTQTTSLQTTEEEGYEIVQIKEAYEDIVHDLQKDNDKLKDTLRNQDNEIAHLKEEKTKYIEDLKSENRNNKTELETVTKKNNELLAEKERNENALFEMTNNYERLKKTHSTEISRRERITQEKDQLKAQDAQNVRDLNNEKRKNENILTELEKLQLQYANLSDELKNKKTETSELEKVNKNLDERNKALQNDIEKQRRNIEQMKYDHNKTCDDLKRQHSKERDDLQQTLVEKTSQHQSLVQQTNTRKKNLSTILDVLKRNLDGDLSVCAEALHGDPVEKLEKEKEKVTKLRSALKLRKTELDAANSELEIRKPKTQDNQLECLECKEEFRLMYDLQKHMIECIEWK